MANIHRFIFQCLSLLALISLSACLSARDHQQSLHSTADREFTLGLVQKEIRYGMSQAEVAERLGSPNIVTKDEKESETWVYDKIASEASYSVDRGGIGGGAGAGGVPGATLLLGLFGGDYNRQAGASATSRKTLTVVIKFDGAKRVKDFSYHSSKF